MVVSWQNINNTEIRIVPIYKVNITRKNMQKEKFSPAYFPGGDSADNNSKPRFPVK